MKSLIICPVGNPITFDDRFEKNNHWRYCKDNSLYDIMVVQYGNFEPEKNTYNFLLKEKGQKWELMKKIVSAIEYENYEYIGFFDDDLIVDSFSIDESLKFAKEKDIKIFQLSMTKESDVFYPILRNDKDLKYAKTNFIEIMGPFIHKSLIPICLELWNKYDIVTGWGFDKILCDLTKTDAFVFHQYSMYHPKKESAYDKTKAFTEMDELLFNIFPKFMKEKYNENWEFKDIQKNLDIFFN